MLMTVLQREDAEVGTLERSLEVALEAATERERARLGDAETSVTFSVSGSGEPLATLLLDRHDPRLDFGHRASEILIEMDADMAAAYVRGELVLAISLLRGQARARGPVRKYLAIEPIIRRRLGRAWSDADV